MTESSVLNGPDGAVRAACGPRLRARSWRAEGLLRMFENVIEIGERPSELVVYAAFGKAARSWSDARRIAAALTSLEEGQTLILQSGRPVGVIETGPSAPLVLSAVNNTVGEWASAERFYEREAAGQTIWGGLTAAAWQYIGRQGVLQGTYEVFTAVLSRHFDGAALGPAPWVLTAGLGGMGSSQPTAATMAGLSSLTVEVDPAKTARLAALGVLDLVTDQLDQAITAVQDAQRDGRTAAVGLNANAADVYPALVRRGVIPPIVTDQTAAHDARYGYVPAGYSLEAWRGARAADPRGVERAARESMACEVEAMATMQESGAVVFENGNNLRQQAIAHAGAGAADRFNRIEGFMEAYLRPLFAEGIGPFRWVALSGSERDLAILDDLAASLFPRRPEVARWIGLARAHVVPQGLPARSCWLGHGERSAMARAVNELVAAGELSAPVLFSRDHLDSAGMTNPQIGTEGMADGSDGVADWPLLDAMALAATGADLVAVHSGGGGYSGWMQSAGVSITADGRADTALRLTRALDCDTAIGVLRHAEAGYEQAIACARGLARTGAPPLNWTNDPCEEQP
ncbi:MAG: urocanate hydratase [Bifidobacteriaceae bacterium]|jgi:urocanate hydratase|nr:urocanate hydratase [Bifidobacteriaceae bacterium]